MRAFGGFLALVFALAALSSISTVTAVEGWYQHIEKPFWTPPDYVFGPVWTALYIMIAVSGWRVWKALPPGIGARIRHPALHFYWLQLALNFLWTPLFFGLGLFTLAALDILAMLASIGLTIRAFWCVDRPAAWLLVPYFLWVAYAATLNLAIAVFN